MRYKSTTISNVADFMQKVRERFAYAQSLDKIDREEAIDDVRFAAANPVQGGGSSQWTVAAIEQRKKFKRPILTENRLPVFIRQVVNDGRQSKPSIRMTPLDGGSKETAEMLQGRIRHIEYDCDADIVYDTARKQQVTSGRGFIRVTYRANAKGELEPCLQRISNQFSVFFGPCKEYDCTDAEFCFVVSNVTKADHQRKFGSDTAAARNAFYSSEECPAPEWFNVGSGGEMVQIAEYWERTTGSDGQVTVIQYVVDGAEPLDETQFLVPFIGIVPQWGDEDVVDGILRHYSLIRNSKDPQRLINLYVSNIAEITTQAPKSPYTAPVGAINNQELPWENSAVESRAVLLYNQYDDQGRTLERPQREAVEPAIQALVMGYREAIDALKATLGMFDSSIGAKSNETSGIAIQRRQREADNANFHFHDNEARTRKTIGRILLALIKVLDTGEKTVSIRSEDGKTSTVRINTPTPYQDETGRQVHYQIQQGDYGVAVSTGPSYTSARKEAFDTYSQIATADPTFMAKAGDILFENLDAPGSEQIAERYRKTLPPGLAPPEPGNKQPIPPEVQQVITQLQQQLQAADGFARSLHEQIQSKQVEQDAKIEIVKMQEETKRTIALAQLTSQEGIELLRQEVMTLKQQLDMDHTARMATQQQQHQADMASQQQAAQQQQAEQVPQ